MRLSIYKDDLGYPHDDPDLLVGGCKIFLDGKEITHAVTADEELGLIVAYIAKDHPDYNWEEIKKGGEWPTETLKGKVEIRKPSNG